MKKIFTIIVSLCLALPVTAKNISILHPNTPGSISDSTSRIIAEGYKRLTGETVNVESISGGFHVPAVSNWVRRKDNTILLTTSTSLVFNQKLIKELPYSDSDFYHVTMISEVINAWVVRSDSPYYNMNDLVNKLSKSQKPFVAYANHSEVVNYHLLANAHNWGKDVVAVKYKGAPETINGLLEGSVEVGVIAVNPLLIGQLQAGNLRIIGQTGSSTIDIAGQNVRSVTEQTGVEQYNGFIGLALSSAISKAEADTIKANLIKVLDDPEVKAALKKNNIVVINKGAEHKVKYMKDFRKAIAPLDFN